MRFRSNVCRLNPKPYAIFLRRRSSLTTTKLHAIFSRRRSSLTPTKLPLWALGLVADPRPKCWRFSLKALTRQIK